MEPLVLASASPQRLRLLEALRLPVRMMPSSYAEPLHDGRPVASYVEGLAHGKVADVVSQLTPPGQESAYWVLGCDTVVVCDGRVIGKPVGADHAKEYLQLLAGRAHQVVSAVVLASPSGWDSEVVRTDVVLRSMDSQELADYVSSGEWVGAAGGYRIQERGAALVNSVTGSYSNVVGLPLETVYGMLRTRGYRFSFV